jgi:hypothetical protein
MIGWIIAGMIAGAVVTACLTIFWENIAVWLNNTAANAIEKVLGYGARNRMHRAVATVDRVMKKIRNQTIVYTKQHELDTHFHKTTLTSEAPIYEIDAEVLDEIEKNNKIVQEFIYKN